MELDKFIERKAESINTIGITDSISDEYLKEICDEYHELKLKKLCLGDVSNRRELYFAFMKEYNALIGESEHQILKEEVEVLLAKYSY